MTVFTYNDTISLCVLQMGGMEAVITGLSDDFKILKRNRKLFTFATAFGTFLIALLCITNVSIPPPHGVGQGALTVHYHKSAMFFK